MRSFYNKIQQRYLNIKRKDVDLFIKDEPAYQITTHEKPKMVNHPNLAHFPNQKWSCDLIDMTIYEGFNKHKKWILTVIDNFSRYVFAVALPNKESKTIIKGFETIRDKQSQGITPKLLINDNGGEFKEPFSSWCEEHNIKQIFTPSHSPTSNALVENFNKYLRKIIREIFIRTNDLNWIDYLDDCVYNRNHSKQNTIKFIPADVWSPTTESIKKDTKQIKQALHIEERLNINEIQNKVLDESKKRAKRIIQKYEQQNFDIGDKCRILLSVIDPKLRKLIKQGNKKLIVAQWSPKVFQVSEKININKEFSKVKYKVEYLHNPNDTPIEFYTNFSFYGNELQKVNGNDEDIQIIPSSLNKIPHRVEL
jgi:hypothetical protein